MLGRSLNNIWKIAKATGGLAFLILMSGANPALAVEVEHYSQEAITAAYLYRIMSYVDWPNDGTAKQQFNIAVLGNDGVADELQEVLKTRDIKNIPAHVHRIRTPNEIGDAQVLYVGENYNKEVASAISLLGKKPILIVTNRRDGLDMGAAINFLLVDQRLRFEVSVLNAERARLKISSALLSVAVRVKDNHSASVPSCAGDPGTDNCNGKVIDP